MEQNTIMEENEKERERKLEQEQINSYLHSLSETERKAYNIAKEHLGTSFHITRSNGFQSWLKKQQ